MFQVYNKVIHLCIYMCIIVTYLNAFIFTLLVGMQTSTATMENSVEIP